MQNGTAGDHENLRADLRTPAPQILPELYARFGA